ncbi:MAG: hypothetical protein EOM40_09525 [Clostridia bacterium]|nr:hypothetical protein [Clostridia bacterium]
MVIKESDQTEFKMFAISKSTAAVNGEKIDITLSTNNTSYSNLYMGLKEDDPKTPVITGTSMENGGWTFAFSVSLSAKGTTIPIVLGKPDGSWYTKQNLLLKVPDVSGGSGSTPDEKPDAELTDAGMKVEQGGTGYPFPSKRFEIKSSSAKLFGDQLQLNITVSGTYFDRIYLGNRSDDTKEPVIQGTTDGSDYTFILKVSADKQGLSIPITAGKKDGAWDTTYDLFLTIPNLNKTFDLDSYTDGKYDIFGNVHTDNEMMAVDKGSYIVVKGDQVTVTLITRSQSYDKIYLGSIEDSTEQKEANAILYKSLEEEGRTDYRVFTFNVPKSAIGGRVPFVKYQKATAQREGYWETKQDSLNISQFLVKTEDKDPTTPTDPTPTDPPTPGAGTVSDGTYSADVESSSSMFNVIGCVLTSKNGKMSAVITLNGTGYDYLYAGTAADAANASKSEWSPFVKNSEGKYTYEIPVSALDTPIPVAAHSISKNVWYDRKLTFKSDTLKRLIENGIYKVNVTSSASMFKVVDCAMTVKNGNMNAVITLSGTGYDYLCLGTAADAEKASSSTWIPFVKNASGQYTYTIPVSALDTDIAVAARSQKYVKWYDRTLRFLSADMVKIGDADGSGSGNGTGSGSGSQTGTGSGATGGTTGGSGQNANGNNTGTPAENDNKADTESKYESDTSGSTGIVNSSTSLKDGVYKPDKFTWSGGTGRVSISCSKITVTGGKAFATIAFSSPYYSYVKANGNKYYGTSSGSSTTFVIPVELNKNNQIIALTTKMSANHEIAYSIFVYLEAAAKADGVTVTGGKSTGNKALDEEAPEIMGLEYETETKLDYAEYFKLYNYSQGIKLLEIDMTKDTALDPELTEDKDDETTVDSDTDSTEDAEAADAETEADNAQEDSSPIETDAEAAAKLYQGNIVKYLLVPEDVEIPVGLDKEMIVVQLPADKAYVASDDVLDILDEIGAEKSIAAVGCKKDECKVDSVAEAMEKEDVIYAGTYDEPEYKELLTSKCNLTILPSDILPKEDEDTSDNETAKDEDNVDTAATTEDLDENLPEEELDAEQQADRLDQISEHFAILQIPMIVDRSMDEKTDLAKYEWIKVYGALFGCEEKADTLMKQYMEKNK